MASTYNPQWLVNRFPNDLQSQVRFLVQKGYTVVNQDERTAQLVRKKKFSFLIALLSILTTIGIILYLIWYLAKRDETIYLELDQQHPKQKKDPAVKSGVLNFDFSSLDKKTKIILIVVAIFVLLTIAGLGSS